MIGATLTFPSAGAGKKDDIGVVFDLFNTPFQPSIKHKDHLYILQTNINIRFMFVKSIMNARRDKVFV